jgi:hypothetical protein
MQELWQPVAGWGDRYEVSNLGRVRSLPLTRPNPKGGGTHLRQGRVLKPGRSNGYAYVTLCHEYRYKRITVHTLVARAFLAPCPGKHGKAADCWQIDHKNEDKQDNRAENLRWLRVNPNRARGRSKLSPLDVRNIRKQLSNGVKGRTLADQYNVSECVISWIKTGKHFQWVT